MRLSNWGEGVNDTRKYPSRPFVGVGAVVVQQGSVLLVKRKHDPMAGQWSLPGGAVEVGETLADCLVRELIEETGLEVGVGPIVEVFDRITHDEAGRIAYHFVLVDYLCWPLGGTLCPGSDVADAVFADPEDLGAYALNQKAVSVIGLAMGLVRDGLGPPRRE